MAPRNKLCGVCGKTTRDFPSPRLYEEHVKKHLDQTYSCDKCDIKFETKISLYDHLSSEQVVEATHAKFAVFLGEVQSKQS